MRRLSARQKSFIAQYRAHGRAREAARAAGYRDPVGAARRLLANEAVRRELGLEPVPAAGQAENEAGAVKPCTVIQGLLDEARRQGPGATHSARVRAWTELGRHLGMFNDQGRIDGEQVEVIYLAPEQYRSVEEWQEANLSESDPKPDRKPN